MNGLGTRLYVGGEEEGGSQVNVTTILFWGTTKKKSFQVPLITRHMTSLRFTSIGGIYLLEESMGPGLSPISCSSLRISSGEREESSSSYLLVSAAAPPLAGRLRGGIVPPQLSSQFENTPGSE